MLLSTKSRVSITLVGEEGLRHMNEIPALEEIKSAEVGGGNQAVRFNGECESRAAQRLRRITITIAPLRLFQPLPADCRCRGGGGNCLIGPPLPSAPASEATLARRPSLAFFFPRRTQLARCAISCVASLRSRDREGRSGGAGREREGGSGA